MNKYILLTKLLHTELKSPEALTELSETVKKEINEKCPEIKWIENYAIAGPYDYLDIFEAETNEMAMKVSVIVSTYGNSTTEIWPVTGWDTFKNVVLHFEKNIHKIQPAEDIVDEISMDSFPASDPPSTTRASVS